MKTTGIVRKIDELGRVVIPKEMCRMLDISANDSLEFSMSDDYIIIKKHLPHCAICGSHEMLYSYNSKHLCQMCVEAVRTKYSPKE